MNISRDQVLFSVKLLVAAMLAFALAVRIGLPQPYWSLVTCCVCMNVMTGAIRSKAVYRLAGTLSAGMVTLMLAALLGSVPQLLIVAAGILATSAFMVSYMDRTPRSYGFQLFAITLMLVAVAGVDHPETMFATVTARLLEIGLGIFMVTIVDAVIAPCSLAPMARANVRRWLDSIDRFASETFDGSQGDAGVEHDRLKLLADISAFSQMTTSLRYDPMLARSDLQLLLAIQRRMMEIVPFLSAIADRIAALDPDERAALSPCMRDISSAFASGNLLEDAIWLRIRTLPAKDGAGKAWAILVHEALADIINDLLRLRHDIRRIDEALEGKSSLDPSFGQDIRAMSAAPLPPDYDHALRMGAGIAAAYIALCCLWAATGWHQGPNAVLMGTVALAFFGGGDEPGRAIASFGRFAVLALVLAGTLSFGLLPLATDFPSFVTVMALFIMPLAAWAVVNPMATLILAFGLSSINLQGQYAPMDFGAFLEGGFSSLLGIFAAFVGAGLFRGWGVRHQIQRYLRIERAEIVRLSRTASPRVRDGYMRRALDRVSNISARLAASGQIELSLGLVGRVRAGYNIAELRAMERGFDTETRPLVERLLARFGQEFDKEVSENLIDAIDDVLSALWEQRGRGDADLALRAVAGLRIALFARASPWVPSQ